MGGYYNPYAAQAAGFSAAHMAAMAAAAQQSGQVRTEIFLKDFRGDYSGVSALIESNIEICCSSINHAENCVYQYRSHIKKRIMVTITHKTQIL